MVHDFNKLIMICDRMLAAVRLGDLAGFTGWGIGVVDDAPGYSLTQGAGDVQVFAWNGGKDTSGAFSSVFFSSDTTCSYDLTARVIAEDLQYYGDYMNDGVLIRQFALLENSNTLKYI